MTTYREPDPLSQARQQIQALEAQVREQTVRAASAEIQLEIMKRDARPRVALTAVYIGLFVIAMMGVSMCIGDALSARTTADSCVESVVD